ENLNKLHVCIAQDGNRWRVTLRITIHKEAPRSGQRNVVRGIFRREQSQVLSIKPCPIQMDEVGIAAFLLADAEKIDDPILLVDSQGLRDVAFACRDWILQSSGLQIVEIE